MGVLAWMVAPALAGGDTSGSRFAVALVSAYTVGYVWQFVLALALVAREPRTSRRDALWLRRPCGRHVWWWVVALVAAYGLLQLIPLDPPAPADREFGSFLREDMSWGFAVLIVVMQVFNTALGEELLFRGVLLPRMRGAFGRVDWIVNGVLFGFYHLHMPWAIPSATVAGVLLFAYPSRRLLSAWLGIAVHSAQTVAVVVALVVVGEWQG
jgi:membrane protease YdiL (CAAX protease family)